MSVDAIQIVGGPALFAVAYAIFYRPVMSILEKRPSSAGDGGVAAEHSGPGEDQSSTGPVSPDGAGDAAHRVRIRWYRDRLLLATILAVFLLDQASKLLVRATLPLHESWPEDGPFRITHGTNTGTAFGLFPNQTLFLILASVLAIGFIYYFYRAHALPSRLLRAAIGLQLGGAVGNLFDRLRSGAVVDFIDVGWWPIFNLADSSIVIGIGLLVAVTFFGSEDRPQRGFADGAGP